MARLFDNGNTEYLEYAGAVVASEPLAMVCWFRSDDISSAQVLMTVGTGGGAASQYHALVAAGATGGDPLWGISYNDHSHSAATSAGYTANTWHHGCALFVAANDRRVFLDGGNKDTDGASVAVTPNTTAIGRLVWPTWYFSGRIAEAGIYDLSDLPGATDSDKADFFESYVLPALSAGYSPIHYLVGLVAYWPLIGRTSPEIDLIGGYDMVLGNAPAAAEHCPVLYASRIHVGYGTTAAPVLTTIRLDWTDVSEHEDDFSIERKTDAGAFGEIDTVAADVETYDNINVQAGHTYTYRVKATSAVLGDSEYSNEAAVIV